ncbi:hypothetical protein H4W81_004150 [Nonomuraea africana]|uniref:Uncharacterized protein n=1 Tax=Nonomuraea africana TaxID=46171 RepID=A0ABR9KHU2_9ACTN|nr:hypothetical protein [Nonomuraea africana]
MATAEYQALRRLGRTNLAGLFRVFGSVPAAPAAGVAG